MESGDVTGKLFEESDACLAPMAGFSDAPFRLLCGECGADFTFTEMVSADGLVRNDRGTKGMLRRMPGEGIVGAQLFGSDPDTVAEAASIVEGMDFHFIDLNFGCPVRKVVRKNGGAAVMRDLDLMGRICRAVTGRCGVPVTAKIRSGWSAKEENFIDAGKVLEDSGIAAVTLHPRYRTQLFSGEAEWGHIALLRRALSVPVIANGDVRTPDDHRDIVSITGCRNVMVGRGALGRPWIFGEIKDRLAGREAVRKGMPVRIDILRRHVSMELEWNGDRRGVLMMRKHYRWYLRGIRGAREYRQRLCGAETITGVIEILNDLQEESEE